MDFTCGQGLFHEPPDRCNIGMDLLPEIETLAVRKNCNPMVPERPADNNFIPRFKAVVPDNLFSHSNTRSIDNYSVKVSPLHDFRIPRDQARACLAECIIH